MKKSYQGIIQSWCRNNQEILTKQGSITSAPLTLMSAEKEISSEMEAAKAVSQIMGEEISYERLFWGVPICTKQMAQNWKISSGYVFDYKDLGWLFIWQHGKAVVFLDKLLFDMEKCYSFASTPNKYILLQEWKIRILIIIVIILIILVCVYIGHHV